MTNKLEQNRKIIADAPEGATHFEEYPTSATYFNFDEEYGEWFLPFHKTGQWSIAPKSLALQDTCNLRSLQDIRENIALQERVAELESTLTVTNKFLHQFTEVCRTGSIKVEGFKAQDKLDNMFREYVAGLDSIQKSETAKEVNNECN